jgi:hypothetical protein
VKITHDLKNYFWYRLELGKLHVNVKLNLQACSYCFRLTLEVIIVIVVIDNHMVVIQVQIGKDTIEDVLLNKNSIINIVMEQL